MKKLVTILLSGSFVLSGIAAIAQNETTAYPDLSYPKNNVKLNLLALPLNTYSVQYERGLTDNISLSLGVRFQPKTGLPFKGLIRNMISESDTNGMQIINNTRISNWAITPEFRYYFGKKPLNGFYVAPFARIGGYTLAFDYTYTGSDGEDFFLGFDGKGTAFTGGLMLGSQWHVGKHFLLDWWIAGASFGKLNFDLDAQTDLSDMSAEDRAELERVLEDVFTDLAVTVTDQGAKAKGSAPIVDLKIGFCIGYTF